MSALTDAAAERAVIGACLAIGHLPEEARALVPEDFAEGRHGQVWAAMLALHAAGTQLDAITVGTRWRAMGHIVGGEDFAYLQHQESAFPFAGNLREWVGTVRDLALRRALVARARALASAATDMSTPAAHAAQRASQALHELSASGTEADEMGNVDVDSLVNDWSDFAEGKRTPYLPCGVEVLDDVFRGFLPNLNLVGGRASVGKTALVAELVWGWLREGRPGGIFGLEDGTRWLVERHCARALSLELGAVGACNLDEYRQQACSAFMGEAWAMLRERLRVHRTSGLAAPDLVRKAERWIARGARWLVVDHGGRIGADSSRQTEKEYLAIKHTAEALDNLAHNSGCPIIVNWHFSREAARREGPPTMEDFRESGYLEAFSGTMLGLWERDRDEGHLLVTVLKNRKGERGVTVALPRDARYGLVRRTGAYLVDLKAEKRAQQDAHEADRQAAQDEKERRKRERAAAIRGGDA